MACSNLVAAARERLKCCSLYATSELPPWLVAHQRMQLEGRTSRVNQPSEAQLAFRIPVPNLSRSKSVRLK
jgi:hypothetical protein